IARDTETCHDILIGSSPTRNSFGITPLSREKCFMRPWRFLLVTCIAFIPLSARADQPFRYTEGKFGKAELRYVNDLPVLVVEGTPEEIGEQVATLTKEPLKRLLEYAPVLLKEFRQEKQLPMLKLVGKSMLPQFPPDHLKEF